jgi:putative ABC transport system permease protein
MQLPPAKYRERSDRVRFFSTLVNRVTDVPGVSAAGAVSYLPFAGLGAGTNFTVEGEPPLPPGQDHVTDVTVCDNGYFRVMGIPLVRGRWFTEREQQQQSNVVIINQALARQYFPRENPIGKRLTISMTDPNVPTEVVGIVGDAKFSDLTIAVRPTSYWPHPQLPYNAMTLTVRTMSDPTRMASAVEAAVHTLDKDQPVSDVRPMDQWIARSLSQSRFSSTLLTIFAAVALLLAAIGIYGVMSYAVSQRTSEIGIRLALGAETGDILSMVIGNAAKLTAIGLAIGVVLALALNRTLASLLFDITPTDPLTFGVVVILLGLVALAATVVPARRAARIAPVEALRYQ